MKKVYLLLSRYSGEFIMNNVLALKIYEIDVLINLK